MLIDDKNSSMHMIYCLYALIYVTRIINDPNNYM